MLTTESSKLGWPQNRNDTTQIEPYGVSRPPRLTANKLRWGSAMCPLRATPDKHSEPNQY